MKLVTNIKKSKSLFFTLVTILILLTGSSVGLTADYYLNNEKIFKGIYIGEWNLGGLTINDAKELIKSKQKFVEESLISFSYNNKIYHTISPKEIGAELDVDAIVNDAYLLGRKENLLKNVQNRFYIAKNGVNLPLKFTYEKEKLNNILNRLASEINVEPKNAELIISPNDEITITDSHSGKKLDIEKTIANFEKALESALKPNYEIKIVVNEIQPKVTTQSLQKKGIKELMGAFTTTFNPNNLSRTNNIKIAASAINKLMLAPGEEFSFNKIVGPRSSAQGYQEAPVIVNGKLTPGIGGGVCQVSSTLYNAVLLSNLEITQRTNHSLPSSYVDLGRDATVTYGGIDFKFRNNSEHYIYLISQVNHNKLTIKIYGTKPNNNQVKIVSSIVEVIEPKIVRQADPTLPEGEEKVIEGSKGYKVKTWRIVQSKTGEEKRELLSQDYYRPTDTVIIYGTKKVPNTQNPVDDRLNLPPNDDNNVNNDEQSSQINESEL
ncbi:MAG TPA: hypothetical protein GXX38_04055 [Clostridia bacterium]|nr:hypothetical protein [Clostridia bacterium]